MTYREAVLTGAKAAGEAHQRFGSREEIEKRKGSIDVINCILRTNTALMFRPLNGLLGACITKPHQGVLISTQRALPIQRFTAAHELGHLLLNHQSSLDDQSMLDWDPSTSSGSMEETQANAFASEFLSPKWLLSFHASRQGWGLDSLNNIQVVYQLSLRIGLSFLATCRTLRTHNLLSDEKYRSHINTPPRDIKQKLLPDIDVTDWHRDIWIITERDEGAVLEGQPSDIFLFKLEESGGAGFLWDFKTLSQLGFDLLKDDREDIRGDGIGSNVTRIVIAQSSGAHDGGISLELKRPWSAFIQPARKINFSYDLQGKERGLPRAARRLLEAA